MAFVPFAFSAHRFERQGLSPPFSLDIVRRPENSNGINASASPLQHERTRLGDANMNCAKFPDFLCSLAVFTILCVWLCYVFPSCYAIQFIVVGCDEFTISSCGEYVWLWLAKRSYRFVRIRQTLPGDNLPDKHQRLLPDELWRNRCLSRLY
jgi:hypothetical protein